MAGKLAKDIKATLADASANGLLTVADTTGFYAGQRGWLNKTGQSPLAVKICRVVDATTMLVRLEPEVHFKGGDIVAPNYGYPDVSAYKTGTIDCAAQFVFNPNDKAL
jgi:hypothetical protein